MKNKKRKRISPLKDASLDLVNLAGVDHRLDHMPSFEGVTWVNPTPSLRLMMEEMGMTLEQAREELE